MKYDERQSRLWHEIACDAVIALDEKRADNPREAVQLAIQTHRYTADEQQALTAAVYNYTQETHMRMGPFEDYRETFLQKEAVRLILDHVFGMI